ncbi:MAG: HAMP domain-containing histidine kinase, partial [Sphingobacteriales bacterium]
TIGLSVTLGLFAIAVTLGLYFQKTRMLNRRLAQSISVRDKLFSIISHDLRGPAGSLKQALELIDTGAVSAEELPEFLSMLKNQSFVLNDTLDTLLIWSRSQLNEISQNPIKFPVLTLINKNLALLEGQYKLKGLSVKVDIAPNDDVYADRDQFEFIIRNLISNAIKFSLPGGKIEIALRKKLHLVELTVRDHGIGISTERQAQFLTGDLDTTFGTSGEKGTGLGLRMVKDFIHAAGGTISIESKKGDTIFNLKFDYPSN